MLHLEEIVELVFILSVAIGLVIDELPAVLRAVQEPHLASPDSLVVGPLALVELPVWVVAGSLTVSTVVAVVALVVAAVLEHYFDAAVGDVALLEATLQDFVLARVQDAVAVGLVIFEISFVEGPTVEQADALATSEIVLEVSFVNVAVFEAHDAMAIPHVLAVAADVLADLQCVNLFELFHAVVDEGDVGAVDFGFECFGYFQAIFHFKRWFFIVACFQL